MEVGGGEPPDATWELDLRGSTPGLLVQVRRWAATELADLGDDHLSDVMLVAVELVTNAFDHGDGPRLIRMSRTRTPCRVNIEVEDSNCLPVTLGRSRLDSANRGRGLVIVDKLADSWGAVLHLEAETKTVWAQISCERSPGPPP